MNGQDNNVRAGVQLLAAALVLYGAKRVVVAGRRPMDPPSLAPSYPRPDVRLFSGAPAFGFLAPRQTSRLAALVRANDVITVPNTLTRLDVDTRYRTVAVTITPRSRWDVTLTARGVPAMTLQATRDGEWEVISDTGAWVMDYPSFDAAVRSFARNAALSS